MIRAGDPCPQCGGAGVVSADQRILLEALVVTNGCVHVKPPGPAACSSCITTAVSQAIAATRKVYCVGATP